MALWSVFFLGLAMLLNGINGTLAQSTGSSFCTAATPYSVNTPASYPLLNSSFKESSAVPSQLSTSAKGISDYITRKHNCLRSVVSPSATNMLKMQWDSETAGQAQTWANNCVYAHNTQAQRTTSKFACGQNIAMSSGFSLSWNQAINLWYNEVNDYAYPSGTTTGAETGHYTQIVWSTSYLVGCGWASCPAKNGNSAFDFYVCNYCPAGNIVDSTGNVGAPYTSGESCAACSGSCEGGKLCTNSCPYTNDYSNCDDLDQSYQICTPGTASFNNLSPSCKATCLCKGKLY